MSTAELLAYLLLASNANSTPLDIQRFCRVLDEEGGVNSANMRILYFLKTLDGFIPGLLIAAQKKCAGGPSPRRGKNRAAASPCQGEADPRYGPATSVTE